MLDEPSHQVAEVRQRCQRLTVPVMEGFWGDAIRRPTVQQIERFTHEVQAQVREIADCKRFVRLA